MQTVQAKIVGLLLVVALCVVTSPAHALQYLVSFESFSCDQVITSAFDGPDREGVAWDIYYGVPEQPDPTVRCTGTVPVGDKYFELIVQTNLHGGLIQWYVPGFSSIAISDGGVYYVALFAKFQKTGSDVWADTGQPDSWDKLLDMCGFNCGGGATFRWGIGVGWPGGIYTATNGKFTFDFWCAQSSFSACTSSDHKVQNTNGYSQSAPYLANYNQWYAIVQEVKLSTSAGVGYMKGYVNGVQTTNYTGVTAGTSSPVFEHMNFNGTFAQPNYNIQGHTRYADGATFTDDLAYLQANGYFDDPEVGGGPPASTIGPRVKVKKGRGKFR